MYLDFRICTNYPRSLFYIPPPSFHNIPRTAMEHQPLQEITPPNHLNIRNALHPTLRTTLRMLKHPLESPLQRKSHRTPMFTTRTTERNTRDSFRPCAQPIYFTTVLLCDHQRNSRQNNIF